MGDPHAVRMQWMAATGIGTSKTRACLRRRDPPKTVKDNVCAFMTLAFVLNLFGTSYSGIRWKPVHFPGVAGREIRLGGVVEPAVLIPPGGSARTLWRIASLRGVEMEVCRIDGVG